MRAALLLVFIAGWFPCLSPAADEPALPDLISSLTAELANYDARAKDVPEWEKQQPARRLWREICSRGGAAEVDAMAKLHARLPIEWQGRSTFFVGVSELWIAREIEAIAAEHPKPLVFATAEAEPPARLEGAPAELIATWREFHAATRAGAQAHRPPAAGKDVESNRAEFFGMLDEFLLRATPELVEKIAAYSSGYGKGAFEQHVREAQLRVAFMDALRRRKLEEAVGLAFALSDQLSSSAVYSPEREGHFIRLLLRACGLDWERLFIGAIAESGGGLQYKKEWCVRSDRLDEELIVHGTPSALRLLVAHEKLHPGANWRSLYTLIEPAPGGKKVPHHYPAKRATAAPDDVQRELLVLAPKWIALDDNPDHLSHIISLLAPLRRPEFAESWQHLAGHVSDRIAASAREALLAMGIEPRPPDTVKLKITLNGKPVANEKLSLDLLTSTPGDRETSLYPHGGFALTTDNDGHAELRKASLLAPKQRPTALVLSAHAETLAPESYQAVFSYWARETRQPEVKVHGWIERIPVPADLAAPIVVNVVTQDCNFRVTNHRERIKGQQAVVSLTRRDGISPRGVFRMPAGEKITIPGIQSGEYEATIWIPGAAEWRGGPFKLDANSPPVDVRLDSGADVKISVLPPGSKQATSAYNLIRTNAPERWHPSTDCLQGVTTYHGLPKGKYAIHIPPSTAWTYRGGPQNLPPYAAREIPFEITDQTPPVLDLGTIPLEPQR